MTLFRELPVDRRDKVIDLSVENQKGIRDAFLNVGDRAQAFLSIILLIGIVLVSIGMYQRSPPSHYYVFSLGSFLVGILFSALSFASNLETTRAALLKSASRMQQVFRSELPIEATDTPPINLRWMFLTSGLGYAAFLCWILGSAVAFAAFVSADQAPHKTALVAEMMPSGFPAKVQSSPPAIVIAPAPSTNTHPSSAATTVSISQDNKKWSVSDTVAVVATCVGFLQFAALVATYIVMRSTARRQIRAYTYAHTFTMFEGSTMKPPLPKKTNEPGFEIGMKNFGQTPAYRMRSWAKMEIIEPINEDKLIVPPLGDFSSQTLPTDGTTSKTVWFGRALTATEIADIAASVRFIYMYGRIEYLDVYGKKHYSNFRVAWSGVFPPPVPAIFSFRNSGNESS